jgi:hypothetical protein
MPLKEETELNVLPLGLLELDAEGRILYYRPDEKEDQEMSAGEFVGHNLFNDFAPIVQAAEFRDRLTSFRRRLATADSFQLNFQMADGWLKAKVLLAQIREHSEYGATNSTLVHIRKA